MRFNYATIFAVNTWQSSLRKAYVRRILNSTKTLNCLVFSQKLSAQNFKKMEGMKLKEIVDRIEQFAPPSLAGSWDNVGLLIEPQTPMNITKILLTNDLTEEVMKECLDKSANMILSYHPPIFKPLKKITSEAWKERIVISCLTNKIALYSPHTAFDAINGGVNDWLISPFGTGEIRPLEEVQPDIGPGRLVKLHQPLLLSDAIQKLKTHLHLSHLRLAAGANVDKDTKKVETIAVCAGSGGSLLRNIKADLWITGELSHHEVLDAIHSSTSVILCEHSNTERGYLKDVFQDRLSTILEHKVVIDVSEVDKDPLIVV